MRIERSNRKSANSSASRPLFHQLFIRIMLAMSLIYVFVLGTDILIQVASHRLDARKTRNEYETEQRALIKNEVEKVVSYILYEHDLLSRQSRNSIQERAMLAYRIAAHLYETYRDSLPRRELETMIIESIEAINYGSSEEHCFITAMDGTTLLPPGVYPEPFRTKEMGEQVARVIADRGGFVTYLWPLSGQAGCFGRKTAYLVPFAPFDWLIGIGRFNGDIDAVIQREILGYIRQVHYGTEGYIFVVDNTGKTLMNSGQPDMIDINISDMVDEDGVNIFREERRAASVAGGDFIEYRWKQPGSETVSKKVSFIMGYQPWDWIIGTGFYVDSVERVISERSRLIGRNLVINAALLACLLVVGFVFSVLFASSLFNSIDRQVHRITGFVAATPGGQKPLDLSLFTVSEFETIAAALNHMTGAWITAEAQIDHVLELSPAAICIFRKDGSIIRANKVHREIFEPGKEADTHISELLNRLIAPPPFPSVTDFSEWSGREIRTSVPLADGTKRIVELRFQLVGKDSMVMASTDITSIMSEREELAADKRTLEGLLREREILIREVHHRVKNNLQIIVSLLRLEEGKSLDTHSQEILKGVMGKVMSIALVHEELYSSGNFTSILLKDYCSQLFGKLQSISPTNQEVVIKMDVEQTPLRMDMMIPVGLILNELFMNSLKYAFREESGGSVTLSSGITDGKLILRYEDSGPGFPEGDMSANKGGLGISLIDGLSAQIGGEVTLPKPGSSLFVISVPYGNG